MKQHCSAALAHSNIRWKKKYMIPCGSTGIDICAILLKGQTWSWVIYFEWLERKERNYSMSRMSAGCPQQGQLSSETGSKCFFVKWFSKIISLSGLIDTLLSCYLFCMYKECSEKILAHKLFPGHSRFPSLIHEELITLCLKLNPSCVLPSNQVEFW